MTLFVLAYLAGVLTIVSPCILPVVPFVLARVDQPFRRNGLPMLVGMALAFAAVASLAAFAGGWAIELNRHSRTLALILIAVFGLALIFPSLSARLTAPLVAFGERLSRSADERAAIRGSTFFSSALLGIATGLLWAPCAGPVLGLILAGAALGGPSIETSLLLLAYAAGAATSLAAALLFGGRLLQMMKRSLHFGERLRRVLGAGILAGVIAIALGLDTGLLTQISSVGTIAVEQKLIELLRPASAASNTAALATPAQAQTPPAAPPLFGTTQWLNSVPLTAESVRGKVVLVNFWTYSCINCLRSLPYVRAWAEKYKDQGLVVIGVHTPEFAFEKDIGNVRKAATSLGVTYPIAIDNDYAVWRSFNNQAWPARYFIDAKGRTRHHEFGEGGYDQSERLIQQLLAEAKGAPVTASIGAISGTGPQAAPDERNLRSGETYVGYKQASNFASPGGIREDASNLYRSVSALPLNHWSLAGVWTIGGEFATLNGASGSISHRFHARDLHLVLAPPSQGHPVRFRVKIDGAPPGADHGSDVDADGWGIMQEDRLYQLVRQTGPVADRTFEIEFFDAGVRAYAFTFG
jgi:cytochrome c biogenesis protein CcdA/thiol-disulfide isomerase/thioredoxin